MQLGFHIDASSCTGCKTCQIACKDLHGLEAGRLFRRVVEIEGGAWLQEGTAWRPEVFAYSLSIACMHCADAACLRGCPSGAITKQDEDGAVVVNERLCLGCRYCEWACPYGAPQFSAVTGTMNKCDLCAGERRLGREPACVAACPMRALTVGPLDALQREVGALAEVFPLGDPEHTRPALVVTLPAAAAAGGRPVVANAEEILR